MFDSREGRALANARVAADPRMTDLSAPLTNPSRIVFDARRMVYGGFQPLVHSRPGCFNCQIEIVIYTVPNNAIIHCYLYL